MGTRIASTDEETARRIVEYCYVVCQGERLRGEKDVALPAPVAIEVPRRAALPEPVAA